jgi:hypothetical protein
MPEGIPVADGHDRNLAAATADLAAARADADQQRVVVLETLIESGGSLLLYRPERQHYAIAFGDLDRSPHVAVMVPGVGTETNLCQDWLPAAKNLFDAAESAVVILWKGYDNPSDALAASVMSIECNAHVQSAASDLAQFVHSLPVRADQSMTVVAHSFGSTVTGAALADYGLRCTDVVVAGSPGMTVDYLRQLHLEQSHFFSEEAPRDEVAAIGIFGAKPTSPTFGGTRLRTNSPGHVAVVAHSSYFVPGSQALENIVDVVTGRYSRLVGHRSTVSEFAGSLVAWTIRIPTVPLGVFFRHYRGPGFRILVNTRRLVDFGATQTGNLVRDTLAPGERALARAARRLEGGHADPPG